MGASGNWTCSLSGWSRACCRVVSVLGLGGIGKSALATKAMHWVAEDFEVVIWRSLRDVPTCEALLDSCLQVLAPQALSDVSASPERRQDLLLDCLRSRRVLLVYDNLESFLEEVEDSGRMRAGDEGFSQVLRRIAETEHQSCLLLTSREKPSDLVPLEDSRAPVRALRLARLDAEACQQLLAEKEVAGSTSEQLRLIEAYAGNPLALKIVARTIVELFEGEIGPFLEQGEVVFGGVRALLDEQYARLSAIEQSVLLWLAIQREPVNLQELLAVLGVPLPRSQVLEAVDSLRRRSLIERGKLTGELHAAIGRDGVCDGTAHCGGDQRDEAGPTLAPDRAWFGTGSLQGLCAADPTAPNCGPHSGWPAQHIPEAHRARGSLARAARPAARTG